MWAGNAWAWGDTPGRLLVTWQLGGGGGDLLFLHRRSCFWDHITMYLINPDSFAGIMWYSCTGDMCVCECARARGCDHFFPSGDFGKPITHQEKYFITKKSELNICQCCRFILWLILTGEASVTIATEVSLSRSAVSILLYTFLFHFYKEWQARIQTGMAGSRLTIWLVYQHYFHTFT